ncbi:MAG: ATP-binding protein [Methylacidiphilales bacterium]|nr:ATP-binding protein [Candidatus Methylacidiphilales bacterium]
MIIHLDADAFFASVEQASDPRLRGKAIAVGGVKRGIIASASYEARKLGVYTPMPTAQARRICPKLIVIPGDFSKYEHFSRMMFSYAYDFTPDVEVGSIDEGYFDLRSQKMKPAREIADVIRVAVAQSLKLSASFGIGSNKLVSQVASKLRKPGCFIEVPVGTERGFLGPLPNRWLPSIGPKVGTMLDAAGLKHVEQIALTSPELLSYFVGGYAPQLWKFAQGIDDRPIVTETPDAQSYGEQETFNEDVTDEAFVLATLQTIETSARRGADIVRQILSFARGLDEERVEIGPGKLLQDLRTIIEQTFPKNIWLDFLMPEKSWNIRGDPTQLHQVLLNLCVNARDAMPEGGELIVSVENCTLDAQFAAMSPPAQPGRYVKFNVTDSGVGIPQENLNKIFEPFFTTKEVSRGTGLGLSTVLSIVKKHQGFIQVYSHRGKGTTFRVYLPAAVDKPQEAATFAGSAEVPRGSGETVLVVDDEASILTITSQTLEAFGYKVLKAADGAEAVTIYVREQKEIDVILTDMKMPVMDGPTTIHALLKINPKIRIIAASGHNETEENAQAQTYGIRHFLAKPYSTEQMLRTLHAVLISQEEEYWD